MFWEVSKEFEVADEAMESSEGVAGCETFGDKNKRISDSAIMDNEWHEKMLTTGGRAGRVRTLVSRGDEGC